MLKANGGKHSGNNQKYLISSRRASIQHPAQRHSWTGTEGLLVSFAGACPFSSTPSLLVLVRTALHPACRPIACSLHI